MGIKVQNTDDYHVLFISDEAWDKLVTVAVDREYLVRKEEKTCKMRGMYVFIRDLMQNRLSDARPEYIHGEWKRYTPRRKRNVKVTQDTLIQARAHALILGIATKLSTDSVRCLSLLLEAYGTGWIEDEEYENE